MRLAEYALGHLKMVLRLPSMLPNTTTFRHFVHPPYLEECIRIFSYRTIHPMRGTVQRVLYISFASIEVSIHKYRVRKYWSWTIP